MGVSLNNRECTELLKAWGFEHSGHNGGHQLFKLNDREVQVTAVGRSTQTPYKAMRKAAQIVGVPLNVFMKGPEPEMQQKQKRRHQTEDEVQEQIDKLSALTETKPEQKKTPTVKPGANVPTDLKCKFCGAQAAHKKGYLSHQRSHETVECRKCGNTIIRNGLGAHMKYCTGDTTRAVGRVNRSSRVLIPSTDAAKELERYETTTNPETKPDPEPWPSEVLKVVTASEPTNPDARDHVKLYGNEEVVALLDLAFPNGLPLNPATLASLAEWVTTTEALIAAASTLTP